VQVLADQQGLHGPAGSVASTPTIWRVLDGIDEAMLGAIRLARAAARDRAWLARGELTGRELPSFRAAGKTLEQVVIDLDATLVTAHSDKEGARGNFKGGFGYHRLGAWLDNTGEALAAVLRPGNAGSNTAADHLAVLDRALTQLPDRWRHSDTPILVRADKPQDRQHDAERPDCRRHRRVRSHALVAQARAEVVGDPAQHPRAVTRMYGGFDIPRVLRPSCCGWPSAGGCSTVRLPEQLLRPPPPHSAARTTTAGRRRRDTAGGPWTPGGAILVVLAPAPVRSPVEPPRGQALGRAEAPVTPAAK
jgi:hypothetical protein